MVQGKKVGSIFIELLMKSEAFNKTIANVETKTNGMAGRIGGTLKRMGSGVTGFFRKVGSGLSSLLVSPLGALGAILAAVMLLRRAVMFFKSIWTTMFEGQSPEKQKELMVLVDGIKTKWNEFITLIGQSGLFDTIINAVRTIYDLVQKWSQEGKLKEWAQSISDSLSKAVTFVMDIINNIAQGNWNKVGDVIGNAIAGAVQKAFETIANNSAIIAKLTSFGVKLGAGIAQGFIDGVASYKVDKDKNPLLWFMMGGAGEMAGGLFSDFQTSTLNPLNATRW